MSRDKSRTIADGPKEEVGEVLNRLAAWLAVVSSEAAVEQPRPARRRDRTRNATISGE